MLPRRITGKGLVAPIHGSLCRKRYCESGRKEQVFESLFSSRPAWTCAFRAFVGHFACYWIPLALPLRSLVFELYREPLGVEDDLKVHDGLGKRGMAKAYVIDITKLRCMVCSRVRLMATSKRRSWRDCHCYSCGMCMAVIWTTKSDLHLHLSTQYDHFLDRRLLQTLSITDRDTELPCFRLLIFVFRQHTKVVHELAIAFL